MSGSGALAQQIHRLPTPLLAAAMPYQRPCGCGEGSYCGMGQRSRAGPASAGDARYGGGTGSMPGTFVSRLDNSSGRNPIMARKPSGRCPLCSTRPMTQPLGSSRVRSQVVGVDVCADCAAVEAEHVVPSGKGSPRECLHFTPETGIVVFYEDAVDYLPLFPHPVNDGDWCRHYVHEANDRLGHGPKSVADIMAHSMAA